jgi:16S rRNA (uracil1498-N3)-methyltransferase
MRRFFYDKLSGGETLISLSKDESRHLFKVLRAEPGDELELLDGRGTVASGVIEDSRAVRITARKTYPEPAFKLHVYYTPPRKQKTDQLLRQCAELGAASLHPMVSERSVSLPELGELSERQRDILIEACKQSGNPWLPGLHPPVSLAEAVTELSGGKIPVFTGDPEGGDFDVAAFHGAAEAAWLTGPEGGFSQAETEMISRAGFHRLKLTEWTMRAETAAVCGAAVLITALRPRRTNA